MRSLIAESANAKVVIIGGGKLRRSLEERVATLGLADAPTASGP